MRTAIPLEGEGTMKGGLEECVLLILLFLNEISPNCTPMSQNLPCFHVQSLPLIMLFSCGEEDMGTSCIHRLSTGQ